MSELHAEASGEQSHLPSTPGCVRVEDLVRLCRALNEAGAK
jgi:hypothetical protein